MTALKALVVYSDIPDGCQVEMVANDAHAPYLRAGEWAVIDTSQTDIEFGQLYSVMQSKGPVIWQVCDEPERGKAPGRPACAWLHPLARQDLQAELDRADALHRQYPGCIVHLRLFMSDGPIHLDPLREQIVGRVVGVYQAESMPLRITTAA